MAQICSVWNLLLRDFCRMEISNAQISSLISSSGVARRQGESFGESVEGPFDVVEGQGDANQIPGRDPGCSFSILQPNPAFSQEWSVQRPASHFGQRKASCIDGKQLQHSTPTYSRQLRYIDGPLARLCSDSALC